MAVRTPRLFAVDVDGTLFNSAHELAPATEAAIRDAQAAGVHVVIATGKGPGPWSEALLPRLRLGAPAILMQGLLVVDGATGTTVLRRTLMDQALAREMLSLGEEMQAEAEQQQGSAAAAAGPVLDVNVFAYGCKHILCPRDDRHAALLRSYGEAPPTTPASAGYAGEGGAAGFMASLAAAGGGSSSSGGGAGGGGGGSCGVAAAEAAAGFEAYKVVFITDGDAAVTAAVRARVEAVVGDRARVVQSIAQAVEVLPRGASKGVALAAVAAELGVPHENIVACGDGENDLEMIRLAGLGVAVGNACALLKAAADRVVASNDEGGAAEALRIAIGGVW